MAERPRFSPCQRLFPDAQAYVKDLTAYHLVHLHACQSGSIVELEGIEPSSKQGHPKLSTRLFRTQFSCIDKTRTTKSMPYSLKLHRRIGTSPTTIPDFPAPLWRDASEQGLPKRCLVSAPGAEIKPATYCLRLGSESVIICAN